MSLLEADRSAEAHSAPAIPEAEEVEEMAVVASPGPERRSPLALVGVWLAVVLVSLWLVLYLLEPLFQQREQVRLMGQYRSEISVAANESNGLAGISTPSKAPTPGTPVAIIEAGPVRLQQAVVEGVGASQTQLGPGHVPGTAGPGQPGNSVIVGRRSMFGGPFGSIGQLHEGDAILVTTTQGQSVYQVTSVEQREIRAIPSGDGSSSSSAPVVASSAAGDEADSVGDAVDVESLYGKSADDRLTLVTSDRAVPWNSSRATIVTASLEGEPFKPTPQGGRIEGQAGTNGDSGAWAAVILAAQAFALTGIAAVLLYRRSSPRVAYLLTAPPFIAFAIIFAESASRLLPAWA